MKLKIILSLFVVIMMFSFVLPSADTTVVHQEKATIQEKVSIEKEPMKPFAMVDKDQFN